MHRDALSRLQAGELKSELSAIYPKYKRTGAEQLIEQFLVAGGFPTPNEFFGQETWDRFHYAVEYRNVLAHECTYLGQDRLPSLIKACEAVLHKLAAAGGLEVIDA